MDIYHWRHVIPAAEPPFCLSKVVLSECIIYQCIHTCTCMWEQQADPQNEQRNLLTKLLTHEFTGYEDYRQPQGGYQLCNWLVLKLKADASSEQDLQVETESRPVIWTGSGSKSLSRAGDRSACSHSNTPARGPHTPPVVHGGCRSLSPALPSTSPSAPPGDWVCGSSYLRLDTTVNGNYRTSCIDHNYMVVYCSHWYACGIDYNVITVDFRTCVSVTHLRSVS